MREELRSAGQSPTYARLTQLRGAVEDAINNAAAQKAVVDDAINDIRRGSVHPSAHDSACLARQSQLADDIERLVPGGGPVDVRQNPAMIELRTRCMPINPNPPVNW